MCNPEIDRATPEEIQEARDTYLHRCQTDDLEIDDDAPASRCDSGLWVQAWVWLSREEDE